MAIVKVTVGTSMKVANPENRFENATFHRTLGIEETVEDRPEEATSQEAYDGFLIERFKDLEARLKTEVDQMISADIKETFE
jgi:hypothetical protein